MEYKKIRTLSCFVKPPWLSEVKRVVGIKKTLLVRLKTFRIWALSSRPTWPSWPTWKSFRTPDMRSQCQLRIKRLIVSIITFIWLKRSCWISTCSNNMDYLSNLALIWFTSIFSSSPWALLRILFVFKVFTQSPMISIFGCRKFQFFHFLYGRGKTRFRKSFSTSQQLRTVLRANYHYAP